MLEVFNHLFNTTVNAHVEEVLRRAVDHPSRRFWVSEERALRVVRAMERDALPPRCNTLKRGRHGRASLRGGLPGRHRPRLWYCPAPAPSVGACGSAPCRGQRVCALAAGLFLRHPVPPPVWRVCGGMLLSVLVGHMALRLDAPKCRSDVGGRPLGRGLCPCGHAGASLGETLALLCPPASLAGLGLVCGNGGGGHAPLLFRSGCGGCGARRGRPCHSLPLSWRRPSA